MKPIFPLAERRRLEVFFAMTTAGFGMFLLLPMESLAVPSAHRLQSIAAETAWGGMFLMNGLMHCVWLAVNGARWWSPIIRYFAAVGSAIIYATWAASFYVYSPASTGVFTYSALAVGAVFCAAFAWHDALSAMRLRRVRSAYR